MIPRKRRVKNNGGKYFPHKDPKETIIMRFDAFLALSDIFSISTINKIPHDVLAVKGGVTEEALCDRYSFSRFAGISLEADVPDHTTICRFRNLLAEKKVLQKLLDEVNGQLASHGKLVKSGCAVDATIITSASRPRKHIEVEMVAAPIG